MKNKIASARTEVNSNILYCRDICDRINCYARCMRESSQRSLEILKSIKERTARKNTSKH